MDPLEVRRTLLRRIEWLGFPQRGQEDQFLAVLYSNIGIPGCPPPPKYNMRDFMQEIKMNSPPTWIQLDPAMSEKFAMAHQKYQEAEKITEMVASGQDPSSSFDPCDESTLNTEENVETYEVIEFPGKKGIHKVLAFRLENSPNLCYTWAHRRTNKTNTVYYCIACKNNKEDKREVQVVVINGRFQSHPEKLDHCCQPLSWEQESYKRKCYDTVRKLRYGKESGVTPMEAYAKMMEEMKSDGVTPDKLFDRATYRYKRASFSRAINAHKKRRVNNKEAQEDGNDEDCFQLDYSEAQEGHDDTAQDVSVEERLEDAIEDVKDFAKLDLPLPSPPSSHEQLLDEMKTLERNYYEILAQREKDQKDLEAARNEAEILRKENQHLKELCEERKRHIDTLQTLISKIH